MKKTAYRAFWQFTALEWLAYATIVLIPLIVPHGHIFAFTGPKSFLMLGIVAVMTMLYAWGTYEEMKKGQGGLRLTWLHGVLALFVTALGLSAVLGVDPHASWFGTFQEGTGLVYICAFIIWSVLVGSLVRRNGSFVQNFLTVAFWTGVLVAIQSFFSTAREIGSSLGNSSFAGAYLLFVICIGVGLLFSYRKLAAKTVTGLGLVVVALCPIFFNAEVLQGNVAFMDAVHSPTLFIGLANGAVFGLGVAVIMMLGLWMTKSSVLRTKIMGLVLCVLILGSLVVAGYQLVTPGTTLNRVFIEQKTASRFVYWDIARAGLFAAPITGFGWGNYGAVYQQYFDPVVFSPGYVHEPGLQDPHNVIWSYASTTGTLGLVAYLGLIAGAFVILYRNKQNNQSVRILSLALAASIIGYFLQNMFVFDTPVSYLILFSVVGIALGVGPVWKDVALNKRYTVLYGACAALIDLVCIACVIVFAILPWRESRQWFDHITESASRAQSPQGISLVGNANDTVYVASNFYEKLQGSMHTEKEKAFYMKKVTLLVDDLGHDINRKTDNYKPYLVRGMLENGLVSLSGKPDTTLLQSARADLERAVTLNPRTPEPYFNLAQTAAYERNFQNAYDNLRAGIALAPEYKSGYEIGIFLLRLAPDKDFEHYIETMKARTGNTE